MSGRLQFMYTTEKERVKLFRLRMKFEIFMKLSNLKFAFLGNGWLLKNKGGLFGLEIFMERFNLGIVKFLVPQQLNRFNCF